MINVSDLSIHTFLPLAKGYLLQAIPTGIPGWSPGEDFLISPLAQGEYSMNYLVQQGKVAWVLRVKVGSQLGLSAQEQIAYEYKTLALLEPLSVSPTPYFFDDSLDHLPFAVLGMSYLPGEPLDYRRDLADAARLFARYHQLRVPPEQNHLIREGKPLSRVYERCLPKLEIYLNSGLGDPNLCVYFNELLAWADGARGQEKFFLQAPWQCLIHTEVNSSNWICNRKTGSLHLVDWERPLWGDPSQDLSHFRVPTTTLWKTEYRMTGDDQATMMAAYKAALSDPHLQDTIEERTALRDPFNCLRAVAWCAMAWVQYQRDERPLKNKDTYRKITSYLDLNFLRGLFDTYLDPGRGKAAM
ncbi:MAG: phosphotransferase family protein [Brevefilum sp.]